MKDYLITAVIALLVIVGYNWSKSNVSALSSLP
jgi:hypothetical protein